MLRKLSMTFKGQARDQFKKSLAEGKGMNMDYENIKNLRDDWK